ncbi:MAG: hypothetical protein R3F19_16005 [Verrucomicrobiales bacterium]
MSSQTSESPPARTAKPLFPAATSILGFVFSRRMLYLLIVMSTLLAIAWQVENWRGRARWEKTKAEILATGESLDWRTFVPEALPDKENAAMHPVFDVTIVPQEPTQRNGGYAFKRDFEPLEKRYFSNIPGDLFRRESHAELDFWWRTVCDNSGIEQPPEHQRQAQEILAATRDSEAGIELISEAFSRPGCHWFPYHEQLEDDGVLRISQVSRFTTVSQGLAAATFIRALCHLENDDSHAAATGLLTALRFSQSMNDRSIVGALVNITTGDIACRHLPLLLSRPEWSEQDLKAISDCLSDSEFLDQLYQTLCRTRAAGVYYFNALINGDQWAIDQVAEMRKAPRVASI